MIAGLFAVVAHETFLDKWGQIGGITGGAIAALLFAGGLARWLLGLYRRPRLTISCGETVDFNRRMVKTLPSFQELVGERAILAVHSKFLRVSETHGYMARDVRATVTEVDPPDEKSRHHLPTKLKWWSGEHTENIVPGGTDFLFLQTVICTDDGGTSVTPPILDHHSPLEFELTLHVGDKVHSRTRFRMEGAWPGLSLMIPQGGAEHPNVPDPFPYPKVTKL